MKVTFEMDLMRDGPEAIMEKFKSGAMRVLIEDLGKEMKLFLDYGSDSLTYPHFNKHKPIKNSRQMAEYVMKFINEYAAEDEFRNLLCY